MRSLDWENEFKSLEFQGAIVDEIIRDESDTTVKSLIYLCQRAEVQRIYHHRFPILASIIRLPTK